MSITLSLSDCVLRFAGRNISPKVGIEPSSLSFFFILLLLYYGLLYFIYLSHCLIG